MSSRNLAWLTGPVLAGIMMPAFAGMPQMHGGNATSMHQQSNMQQRSNMHRQSNMQQQMHRQNTMRDQVDSQQSQDLALAHKMMGHINLAQVALEMNLPDDASRQIGRARNLAETLAARRPEWKFDSTFEYGKVTYSDESSLTERYIPVLDDTFLVSGYEAIFEHSDTVDVDALSAGALHVRVAVDPRDVEVALDEAEAAIGMEDYAAASSALGDVFRTALIDEQEVDDPKLLIAENLALAKAFTDEHRYESARLTLRHVQDRLQRAEVDGITGMDEDAIAELSAELDRMRAELRKKDPTLSQRVADDLESWGDRIAELFG